MQAQAHLAPFFAMGGGNQDVLQFEILSFLRYNELGTLACVSKQLNDDVSDDVAWGNVKDGKAKQAISTLNNFIEKHYEIRPGKLHENTDTNMHVTSWSKTGEQLDVVERTLVRHIVRRNVPRDDLIRILIENDESDEQFELLRSIIFNKGYIRNDEDDRDMMKLIEISEYANLIRLHTLDLYNTVSHAIRMTLADYAPALQNHMDELYKPTKNYYSLYYLYTRQPRAALVSSPPSVDANGCSAP